MSQTTIPCAQQSSEQRAVPQRQETAECLLRDLAFVYHATQLVKKAMATAEAVPCVA